MLYLPTIGTKLSGSLGGITASRGRGGGYFRSRVVPTNPSTERQGQVRTNFARLSIAWKDDLTPSQRTAWGVFATNSPLPNRIGEIKVIPPLAWYIKANSIRALANRDRVDNAPATFGLGSLGVPTNVLIEAPNDVNFVLANGDDWAKSAQGAFLVFVSAPQNPGVEFFKGPYQFAGQVNGALVPPTGLRVFTTPNTQSAGQKVFVRLVATQPDGRPTTEVILSAIVT